MDGRQWGIRSVQLDRAGATATDHSLGEVTRLADGRVRVEDVGEWASKAGAGQSGLEAVRD